MSQKVQGSDSGRECCAPAPAAGGGPWDARAPIARDRAPEAMSGTTHTHDLAEVRLNLLQYRMLTLAGVLLLGCGGHGQTPPRPGQMPQHEQMNPQVAYRVSNALEEGTQFYMGGEGIEYFDVYTHPIRTKYSEVYWINVCVSTPDRSSSIPFALLWKLAPTARRQAPDISDADADAPRRLAESHGREV
eukprot:COSAG02_NODE_21881_length_771_cov_1.747024_1_plen_189_part_00